MFAINVNQECVGVKLIMIHWRNMEYKMNMTKFILPIGTRQSMGYDYLVKKGTTLIISVSTGYGKSRKFKMPVKEGDEIYYELYMEDGDLESR